MSKTWGGSCWAVVRTSPWCHRHLGWHDCGMSRTRLSTTVDNDLLQAARRLRSGDTDAAMIDEALRALVARHRSAEIEASYTAYDEHPLDEPDEWGDLASFREAAGRS
jgi:Bacterial antitoxin of type II TA system, VapB